jgi:outer membrane beta-barrel protein
MKSIVLTIVLLIYSAAPQVLFASERDRNNEDRVYVVQEKIFHRYHEAGIFVSYIPDDDFFDSYGIGANYVYHFNDIFSWEVFRGAWIINKDKSIRNDIKKSLNIAPKFYDEPSYMVYSQLWFRPLYGKSAVCNKKIIFHETGFFAGTGLLGFDRIKSFASNANDTALTLSFGMCTTFFLNSISSFSLQIRDLMHFKENQTENRISLELGYSFRFNMSPRKRVKNKQDLDTFNRYIK